MKGICLCCGADNRYCNHSYSYPETLLKDLLGENYSSVLTGCKFEESYLDYEGSFRYKNHVFILSKDLEISIKKQKFPVEFIDVELVVKHGMKVLKAGQPYSLSLKANDEEGTMLEETSSDETSPIVSREELYTIGNTEVSYNNLLSFILSEYKNNNLSSKEIIDTLIEALNKKLDDELNEDNRKIVNHVHRLYNLSKLSFNVAFCLLVSFLPTAKHRDVEIPFDIFTFKDKTFKEIYTIINAAVYNLYPRSSLKAYLTELVVNHVDLLNHKNGLDVILQNIYGISKNSEERLKIDNLLDVTFSKR